MSKLAFTSQQPLAKKFRKYCFRTLFPQIRDHFEQLAIAEKDREHRLAIEDMGIQHQLAIALVNDDLVAAEHEIFDLELEVQAKDYEIDDLVANRHVPQIDGIDNILAAYVKNKPGERLPYYMIRCQRRVLNQQIKILRIKYPDMEERGIYEDPNAVQHWVSFREEILGREQSYFNHFGLNGDRRDLFEGIFNLEM